MELYVLLIPRSPDVLILHVEYNLSKILVKTELDQLQHLET